MFIEIKKAVKGLADLHMASLELTAASWQRASMQQQLVGGASEEGGEGKGGKEQDPEFHREAGKEECAGVEGGVCRCGRRSVQV